MASVLDVRTAFSEMVYAAHKCGVDTHNVAITIGNKRNGIGYRVYTVNENGSHGNWPYVEYMGLIGTTRGEAIATLKTMKRVFEGILTSRREGKEI